MSERPDQELARLADEQRNDRWRAVSVEQLNAGVSVSGSDPRYLPHESPSADAEADDDCVGRAVDILGQRLAGGWGKTFGWEPALDQIEDAIEHLDAWERQPDEVYLVEVWARVRREAAMDLVMGLHARRPLDGPPSEQAQGVRALAAQVRPPSRADRRGQRRGGARHARLLESAFPEWQIVYEIIQRHQNGESQRVLAAEYGTSQSSVSRLCSDPEPGEEKGVEMITQTQAAEMLQLLHKIDRNTETRNLVRDLELFVEGARAQSEAGRRLEAKAD